MNVAQQADAFLKSVEKGFNGVPLVNMYREGIWHEQYAIFVLQFETLERHFFRGTKYDNYKFDEKGFFTDLEEYMRGFFPDCHINYSSGCFEWEICGPKCTEFFKEHSEKLEELELDRDGHLVYNVR